MPVNLILSDRVIPFHSIKQCIFDTPIEKLIAFDIYRDVHPDDRDDEHLYTVIQFIDMTILVIRIKDEKVVDEYFAWSKPLNKPGWNAVIETGESK
jgi:hypothetical protein